MNNELITRAQTRMAFLPYFTSGRRPLCWHDVKNIIANIPAAEQTAESKPFVYAVRLFLEDGYKPMAELAFGDGGFPNGNTVVIELANVTEREKYCINAYTFVWDERPVVLRQSFSEYVHGEDKQA